MGFEVTFEVVHPRAPEHGVPRGPSRDFSWKQGSRWHETRPGEVATDRRGNETNCRISTRVRLTTDGHKVYVNAVEDAFGADVDYAMLTKVYGAG